MFLSSGGSGGTVPGTYLDFDLLIEHAAQGYRAKVLDSPTGQAAADFSLPFSSQEMEIFLLRLTRSLSEARRRVRRLESQERELVKGFGGQLFQAMFSGAVLGALQSSLNEAFRKDAGLRIRLRLTDTPELADVPWEFLFNSTANRFLNLTPDTPLIRYLDLPMPVRPLTVTPPLRVLVMISSPVDFPQLDVEAEWVRLNAALGDLVKRGLVTITRLPNASLAGLQRPLRLDKYHIFHFIGHCGFDEHAQDGALALEDAQGRARLVTGQDLGVMLSSHHSLRLIVLNACEGARAASSDPFAGVAQSLVQQGVPAVIAMQFEITDEAAITFAQELYAAIADGYSVDAALGESRRAIFASGNDVEWATPVLYTRSPNGQLFRVTKRSTEAERVATDQAEREEAERLAKEQPPPPPRTEVPAAAPPVEEGPTPVVVDAAPSDRSVEAPAQGAPASPSLQTGPGKERPGPGAPASRRRWGIAALVALLAAALLIAGILIWGGDRGAETAANGASPGPSVQTGSGGALLLASFETGTEGWAALPDQANNGRTSQASDFHTEGSSSLRVDSAGLHGRGWYGTEFHPPIDISGKSSVSLDIRTMGVGTQEAIAVQFFLTEDTWIWCQSPDWGRVGPGTDATVTLDFDNMDCGDSPPPSASDRTKLAAMWVWFEGKGSFRVDNVQAK
jgi:hypothetical protein